MSALSGCLQKKFAHLWLNRSPPLLSTWNCPELPGILKEDPFWLWEGVDVPIEMKVAREDALIHQCWGQSGVPGGHF